MNRVKLDVSTSYDNICNTVYSEIYHGLRSKFMINCTYFKHLFVNNIKTNLGDVFNRGVVW